MINIIYTLKNKDFQTALQKSKKMNLTYESKNQIQIRIKEESRGKMPRNQLLPKMLLDCFIRGFLNINTKPFVKSKFDRRQFLLKDAKGHYK